MTVRSPRLRSAFAAALAVIFTGTSLMPATAAGPTAKDIINNSNRTAVVNAYLNTFKPTLIVPTEWTGNVDACDRGTTSLVSQKAELTAINYMRAMADLSPVTVDATLSKQAQASALVIEANQRLSHTPSDQSACFSDEAFLGASRGNIARVIPGAVSETAALSTGARGVALYMEEPGSHNATAGHRRWLLSPSLTEVGLGDTHHANTIVVIGGALSTPAKQWVMWPTAGYFPREIQPNGRWSVSYPDADFTKTTITVTTPHGRISTKKQAVALGYAENTLVWDMRLPQAYYNSTADYPVTVTVRGIRIGSKTVTKTYRVTIVDADPLTGN